MSQMTVEVMDRVDGGWVKHQLCPAPAGVIRTGGEMLLWVALRASGYGYVLRLKVLGEVG